MVVPINIFVENKDFIFVFKESFVTNFFTVTLNQCNASLLNRSINLIGKTKLYWPQTCERKAVVLWCSFLMSV